MTPYDQLALMPDLIAETVCGRPYTGRELSDRGSINVQGIERARLAMTDPDIAAFAAAVDDLCRRAYERRLAWFMRLVKTQSNRGRDQLYAYVTHWMAAYLVNPEPWLRRHRTVGDRPHQHESEQQ